MRGKIVASKILGELDAAEPPEISSTLVLLNIALTRTQPQSTA
jgi:hypothetical protein